MPEKVCVITGASRGIGLATALRFARDDHRIVAVARNEADLVQARKTVNDAGGECEIVSADVSSADGAQRVVDVVRSTFNRIDVLVNNAGVAPLKPLVETTTEEFERCIAVNIGGVFHMTKAAWPLLQADGGGAVVNISSNAAFDPFPGFSVYGGTKAWVNIFTKAVAGEGKQVGIRVFAVAPGAVETEMLRSIFPSLPAKQTLAADDVAAMIHAVTTPAYRHCVGETLLVRR